MDLDVDGASGCTTFCSVSSFHKGLRDFGTSGENSGASCLPPFSAMDPLPQLPEHEAMPAHVSTRQLSVPNWVALTKVVVVNTFLQVKDRPCTDKRKDQMCLDDALQQEKRPDFGRAGTAPALRHTRTLDLEEETPAGANDGDDAEANSQETEEAPDEERCSLLVVTRGLHSPRIK